MNNKKYNAKTIEERIYESLGVLHFRKFVMFLQNGLRRVTGMGKTGSGGSDNYYLTEMSMEGLKKFKRQGLLVNTAIHLPFLISGIFSLTGKFSGYGVTIESLISPCFNVALNGYCVMLQRYNHIRINRAIKMFEEREARKQQQVILKEHQEINSDLEQVNQISTQQSIELNSTNEDITMEEKTEFVGQEQDNLLIIKDVQDIDITVTGKPRRRQQALRLQLMEQETPISVATNEMSAQQEIELLLSKRKELISHSQENPEHQRISPISTFSEFTNIVNVGSTILDSANKKGL